MHLKLIEYNKRTYISAYVIEFGDESMFDDIHCNLWGHHHGDVRK